MSRRTRRATAALAAGLTGALALAACGGGSGFDNGSGSGATQSAKSGPVTLKFMITSNGPADVKLQQDTVKPWEDKTGNKVEVIAASDMNQQLTRSVVWGCPSFTGFVVASNANSIKGDVNRNYLPYTVNRYPTRTAP